MERSKCLVQCLAQTAVRICTSYVFSAVPSEDEKGRRWARDKSKMTKMTLSLILYLEGVPSPQTCQCPVEPRQDDDKEPDEETKTEALDPVEQVGEEGLLSSYAFMDINRQLPITCYLT